MAGKNMNGRNLALQRFKKVIIAVRFIVSLMDSFTYQPSKYKDNQAKRLTKKIQADEKAIQQLLTTTDIDLKVHYQYSVD